MTDAFHIKQQLETQKQLNKELLRQNFKLLAENNLLRQSKAHTVDLTA